MTLFKNVIQPTQKTSTPPEVLAVYHELKLFPEAVLDCRINDVCQQEIREENGN